MAKLLPSPIGFSGNFGEFNFVYRQGKRYVRRKRGTVKPAKLNESFRNNANRNAATNGTVSCVINALKKYGGAFRDNSFARGMQRRVKKCVDDKLETHLASLKQLDLNSKHRFERHVALPVYTIHAKKDHVVVNMSFRMHPHFRDNHNNSYYYEIILLLWDNRSMQPHDQSIKKEWVHYDDEPPCYELLFPGVTKGKNYLLVVKLVGGEDKKSEEMMRDRAMLVLEGWKL